MLTGPNRRGRSTLSKRSSGRSIAANIALAIAAVVIPVGALELALRPFADLSPEVTGIRRTTLFVADDRLGWRLRPGADDVWGGTRVKINAKGLRGPELTYAKPAGTTRILYLGDSVPFGYKLPSHEQTYPYLIQSHLERAGMRVQTVNAGVGGYSPWQSYGYLQREGIHYEPDVVVVTFVLNDVTEKFDLIRFGGSSEGFQLARSVRSLADRVLAKSAIRYFGRRLVARARFGEDVQAGARGMESLRANTLALAPERADVQRAWEITLGNLGRIFTWCDERGVAALLVAFPYTFQLEDPERYAAPQQVLARWASARGVAFLDLLPVYAKAMQRSGEPASTFFLDQDHPSARGNVVAARAIEAKLREADWLDGR